MGLLSTRALRQRFQGQVRRERLKSHYRLAYWWLAGLAGLAGWLAGLAFCVFPSASPSLPLFCCAVSTYYIYTLSYIIIISTLFADNRLCTRLRVSPLPFRNCRALPPLKRTRYLQTNGQRQPTHHTILEYLASVWTILPAGSSASTTHIVLRLLRSCLALRLPPSLLWFEVLVSVLDDNVDRLCSAITPWCGLLARLGHVYRCLLSVFCRPEYLRAMSFLPMDSPPVLIMPPFPSTTWI